MRLTVAICAYNSETRIIPTLDHLANQDATIDWNLLIIDNGSTDRTAEVARNHWNSISSVPLSIVKEPEPGLSMARLAAVNHAVGDFLVFVDDDNWLDVSYVQNVVNIFDSNPSVVATGGPSQGNFESEPPATLHHYIEKLAIGGANGKIDSTSGETLWLWGAGMALRLDFLRSLYASGFKSQLQDRTGKSLLSGGDTELCLALRLAGGKLLYSEDLKLVHWMPKARLTESYIPKLVRGQERSEVILDIYRMVLKHPEAKLSDSDFTGSGFSEFLQYMSRVKQFRRLRNSSGRFHESVRLHALLGRLDGRKDLRAKRSTLKANIEFLIEARHKLSTRGVLLEA